MLYTSEVYVNQALLQPTKSSQERELITLRISSRRNKKQVEHRVPLTVEMPILLRRKSGT